MLKALLIDMDGTLADSLFLLYQLYLSFLEQYGIQGTKEEFETLNGLTIEEVMEILVKKYGLRDFPSVLASKYRTQLDKDYQENLEVFPDAKKCLVEAKRRGLRLALVTSAKLELAQFFLQQHELKHMIDNIVTAEGLDEGKPSSQIYLKALEEMSLHPSEAIAIEDADNGIKAAIGAGIPTIRFNPDHSRPCSLPILAEAKNWDQICRYLSEMPRMYPMKEIVVRPTQQLFPKVDDIWNACLKENPRLFNGKLLNFVFMTESVLEGEFIEYKYYLANLKNPELKFGIAPVAVCGVIETSESVLIGKRSSYVSTWACHYETPPSGVVDPISEKCGKIDALKQMQVELFEETDLRQDDVMAIEPVGIVEDPMSHLWEVFFRIKIREERKVESPNGEYQNLFFVKKKDLSTFIRDHYTEIIPFTRYLLELILHEI